ncbi:MAG: type III-B CRISPR module RAMP protein Cmr6 [candidate division WOR-3 bacterium]
MKYSKRNQRFKVEGKIWWGNKYFLKDNLEKVNKKEEEVKERFIIENFPGVNNFILLLNKYIPIINAKVTDFKENKEKIWFALDKESIGGDSKKFFLKGIIKILKNNTEYYQMINNFKKSINNQVKSLENQGYKSVFSDLLITQSRLIIGLGSANVLETSITLHHIYGIPYIPASALKGVCRMVSFWKIAESKGILNNERELDKLQNEFYGELSTDKSILKYQLLFGAQNFKGLLLFLDSYPEIQNNQQIFDLDVMNVHYPSYYEDKEGKNPPGDWENPRPVFFLTLKEGIKFNFNILFDRFRSNKILKMEEEKLKKLKIPLETKEIIGNWIKDNEKDLKEPIKNILTEALKEFGVGAKTRLGYGIFKSL